MNTRNIVILIAALVVVAGGVVYFLGNQEETLSETPLESTQNDASEAEGSSPTLDEYGQPN